MLRSTLLAVVSSFAPSATNKVNKLHVLGQLGLVGEGREKVDVTFLFAWTPGLGMLHAGPKQLKLYIRDMSMVLLGHILIWIYAAAALRSVFVLQDEEIRAWLIDYADCGR